MYPRTPKWLAAGRIAVWMMLGLMSLPAWAREKPPSQVDAPPPPPEPNEESVQVPRGGPVWIPLTVYSLTSPIIRFRIPRLPKAGKLGVPELVDEETGRVKYTPPEGAGPGADSFEFQVQSDAGVSVPAEVRIKITDRDPMLIAPGEIDFGRVLPGETARRSLVVQNIGGGLAQGDLQVPKDWMLEGEPGYRLGAGAKQIFVLIFKGTEPKKYTGDVIYTGEAGRATDLDAEVAPPISVESGTVELAQTGGLRLGTIQVENHTRAPVTLRVTPGPALEADASIAVPGNGTAQIVVRARSGGGDTEIQDHLTVEGEGTKTDIAVHAAPIRQMTQIAAAGTPQASVNPRPGGAGRLPAGSPRGEAGGPRQSANGNPQSPEPPDEMDLPSVPQSLGDAAAQARMGILVTRLHIVSVGQDAARVSCTFNGIAALQSFRVEAQTVIIANGKAQSKWVPLADVKVQIDGKTVTADLTRLHPNAQYVLRIAGADAQGEMIAMSTSTSLWTLRPKPRNYWGWGAAVAVLAGGAWWRWRKRTTR